MLIYRDTLEDYEIEEQEELCLIVAQPTKQEWGPKEIKVTSAITKVVNNQVVDLGLPHGFTLDSRYKHKPIVHRFVVDGTVYWRKPGTWQHPLGEASKRQKRHWNALLDRYPCLVDAGFFYNHTLVFAKEAEKLKLIALVHLSNGELEDAHEVIAVAEHFGLDYDP